MPRKAPSTDAEPPARKPSGSETGAGASERKSEDNGPEGVEISPPPPPPSPESTSDTPDFQSGNF